MKWLKRAAMLLATLITALLLAIVAAVNSQWGLQASYQLLRDMVPGSLRIGQLEGKLAGPLSLTNISYKNDSLFLEIDKLRLDWTPAAILHKTLHIENLQITGINYSDTSEKKAAEANGKTSLPSITLPIQLHINQATLSQIHIATATTPLVVDTITLSARSSDAALYITRMHIDAAETSLDINGKITPSASYPAELRVGWLLADTTLGRVAGHAGLSGDLRRLAFTAELTSPFSAQASGSVSDILDTLRWQSELQLAPTSLQKLDDDWPNLSASLTAQAQGDLQEIEVVGNATTAIPSLTLEHAFDLHYKQKIVTLRKARIHVKDQSTTAMLHGEFHLEQPLRGQLSGDWQHLRWPLEGDATLVSYQGRFSINGTMDAYMVDITATLAGQQLPAGEWTLAGQGDRQKIELSQLQGVILDGTVAATGHVQWLPHLNWQTEVSGYALNPARQWPQWPGKLDITATSSGTLTTEGLSAALRIAELHGKLRDLPVNASLDASMQPARFELHALNAAIGDNHLRGSGSLGEQWALDWQVDASSLETFLPAVAGELRSDGQLRGTRNQPLLSMRARGKNLVYQDQRIEEITLSTQVDVTDATPSQMALTAEGIEINQQHLESVTINVEGTIAAHTLHATLLSAADTLAIEASGGYRAPHWRGALRQLDLHNTATGDWRLQQASEITASIEEVNAAPFCLLNQRAELCAQARWSKAKGWAANAQAQRIPLAWATALLPQYEIAAAADISANLSAEQVPNNPLSLQLAVDGSAGALSFVLDNGEPLTLGFSDITLSARTTSNSLLAELEIPLDNGGGIVANAQLPRAELPGLLHSAAVPQTPLQGHAQLVLPDLSVLPAFVTGIENTKGRLTSTLRLSGTMETPAVNADVTLNEGSATLPALGITVDAIHAQLQSDPQGRIQVRGEARSGGVLAISGEILPDESSGWLANIRLLGERIEAAHTPEYHVLISPDMQIKVAGQRIELTGDLTIPEANIRPRDLAGAVKVSDDVVIAGTSEPTAAASRWQVYSQIRLRLGDSVRFKGFGLNGRLGGEVALNDVPLQPVTASGELRVEEGVYRAYGQKLTIERGKLLFFGGAIDNPGLDIRALRHVAEQNVTAGILARGSLKAPQISLFSEPAMAEADALSFLLFGRPINQASSTQGQQLYGAATSLGLAGGGLLASQIGNRFGIKDVRVESGAGFGNGALVIRHYLTPSLYVSYGVGLFERFNTFVMRYQLNRLWALEAETGIQSGADIIYTLERK